MASDACVKCGQPGALFCEHADINGQVDTTTYCSKTCQAADWPAHKAGCSIERQRLKLCRRGELLQHIFYIVRAQAFDSYITKVEKDQNGLLHVYEACPPDDDNVLSKLPPLPLQTFDEDDKKAVLSYLTCTWSQALQVGLAEKAFAGTRSPLKSTLKVLTVPGVYNVMGECTVHLRRDMPRLIRHQLYGIDATGHQHTTTHVTTKKGEMFIVDTAGAQFGQHPAVVAQSEYDCLFQRPGSSLLFTPFGHMRDMLHATLSAKTYATPAKDLRLIWVTLRIKARLDQIVGGWKKKKSLTLASLLKLSSARLTKERADLLKTVREGILRYIRQSKGDGTFSFERVRGQGPTAVFHMKEL